MYSGNIDYTRSYAFFTDNIKPSYAKYGPLREWERHPDLEMYLDYHDEQMNKLIVEQFDYVEKLIDENGGTQPPNDPHFNKLERQIKRLKLKLSDDCEYYFVSPIPFNERVKKWNLSANSLLERCMTLAKLKKIQKKELCDYMREYVRNRSDWGVEEARRFRAILHTLKKNKSKNCGRFILRDRSAVPFLGQDNNYHEMEWKYRKVCMRDPYNERLDKLRFVLQRRLNQQEDGRDYAYDTGGYHCHLQKHFFIGPVRGYYINDSNPEQKWAATHADNFFYTVNAHGDFVHIKKKR